MREQEKKESIGTKRSKKKGKEKVLSALYELLIYVAIFILCLVFVPKYICCKYTVEGISMERTLEEGQQLLGEKISYRIMDPKRYDVVVVQPFEGDEDNYYVKRVIGLPGETIEIKDGILLIDGKELDESDYIKEDMWETTILEPITLGEDEFFVMGDNRNYSSDSRETEIGPIPKDRIIANLILRVWPLSEFAAI